MLGVAVLLLGMRLALVCGEKPKNRANFSVDDKARIASSKPQLFSLSSALRFPVLLEKTAAALKNFRYLAAVIGLLIVVMPALFFYFFFGLLTSGAVGPFDVASDQFDRVDSVGNDGCDRSFTLACQVGARLLKSLSFMSSRSRVPCK